MKNGKKWILVIAFGCTPEGSAFQDESPLIVDRACCSSKCSIDVTVLLSQPTDFDGCNVHVKGHLFDLGDHGWQFGTPLLENRIALDLQRPIPVEGLSPGTNVEVELEGRVTHGGDRLLVRAINGVGGVIPMPDGLIGE